ncbi:MAG: MerR family DNA-binding protein [Gemmatimonadota bacterium]
MDVPEVLTIGQLASRAGVGVETLRFYERKGLLPPPPRTPAGYRQYPADMVRRVAFIRRAQGLGFTLAEIHDLLDLRVESPEACGAVEARAREKLASVEEKMQELRRIRRVLGSLVEACAAREPTSECPILEELTEDVEGG